jgi:hypothetical protein
MAPERDKDKAKPPAGRDPLEAQDRSIKARKTQLFEAEDGLADASALGKPFKAYVLTTPAAPLSPFVKGLLWTVAGLVTLLFLVAMYHGLGSRHHHRRRRPAPAHPPASKAVERHPDSTSIPHLPRV